MLTDGVLICILLNAVHSQDGVILLHRHIPALHFKVLVELLPAYLQTANADSKVAATSTSYVQCAARDSAVSSERPAGYYAQTHPGTRE